MKLLLVAIVFILIPMKPEGIHDYKIQALDSPENIDLSEYRGKKILIVNVASECGFTPQYEGLQKLYDTYKDKLVVIGFPCNQFGGQEPGEESLIQKFCSSNYRVTFPMTTKVDVKGNDQHPVYAWLTSKDKNGVGDFRVTWNFNKFLIDEKGTLVKYFPSSVKPMDEAITELL